MVARVERQGAAEDVLAEVTRVVREASGVGGARDLPPEEPLSALGLDSLAIVNVVAAVEGRYARELPDGLWKDRRGISIASLAAALAAVGEESALPRGAHDAAPGEQPGVSRVERLFLQLEGRGPGGRVTAGALHHGVIAAHWLRANQPCVVLTRELDGELPIVPLPDGVTIAPYDGIHDEPLAGIWTRTQAGRMRSHLRRRMNAGMHCLAAWEAERIVAYDLLGPSGAEDVTTSPGTCFGLNLYERRESRGRGIGLALLAASLPYTRDLGFSRQ